MEEKFPSKKALNTCLSLLFIPARAADDTRFHEWKHPDHAAEPCFCPAVRRHGAAAKRSPYGWPLHKSGASYTHNAGISGSTVFQPRNWYASALDRAV